MLLSSRVLHCRTKVGQTNDRSPNNVSGFNVGFSPNLSEVLPSKYTLDFAGG